MYSRKEVFELRQEFWTIFGKYMSPILSSEGEKVNWINYKTGEKWIYIKLEADNCKASIRIELLHPTKEMQQLYFNKLKEFRTMLRAAPKKEWLWQLHTQDEHGKTISKIEATLDNANIFRKEDWPSLISFFKNAFIALDEFWNNVKYRLEDIK